MARETKVGLLIGVGVILLIAIIVNDALVATKHAEEPEHLTRFAEAAQQQLAEEPARGFPLPPQAATNERVAQRRDTDRAPQGQPGRSDAYIPTAQELEERAWAAPRREMPPRSAQGLPAAMNVDIAAAQQADRGTGPGPAYRADQFIQDDSLTLHRELAIAQLAAIEQANQSQRDTRLPIPANLTRDTTQTESLRQDPPSHAPIIHYVKTNESMWTIAQKYLGDGSKWKLIADANPGLVGSNAQVNVGVRLVIPSQVAMIAATQQLDPAQQQPIDVTPRGGQVPVLYTVKTGDSLYKIAQTALGDGSRYSEIYELNRDQMANANTLKLGMKLKLPPTAAGSATAGATTATRSNTDTATLARAEAIHRDSSTTTTEQLRPTQRVAEKTYTVKAGDNLIRIARATLGDDRRFKEIYEANRDVLSSENDLEVGQVLRIPS